MYSCKYADEPVDFKLMLIQVCRRWLLILLATVCTAAIFGGAYYLKTFVLNKDTQYMAKSQLYLEYSERVKLANIYINDFTWQELAKSDQVIDYVIDKMGNKVDREIINQAVYAGLETDVRVVILKVTTNNPELSVELAGCYEEALILFGSSLNDIDEVKVLVHATEAKEPEIDNRILRMLGIGAIIGAVFSTLGICLFVIMDDAFYVPIAFEKRYKLPYLGMFTTDGKEVVPGEMEQNMKVMLRDCEELILTGAQSDEESVEVLKILESGEVSIPKKLEFCTAGTVNGAPEKMKELLGRDGVILVVKAGVPNSRIIERTVNYIEKQGGKIWGVILYHGDKKLLKKYYAFSPRKKED